MKIKEVRKHVDAFSSKASELSRQLAFAGIAVVWIFKNSGQNAIIPNDFLLPLLLLVLTLVFDFLQYVLGSIEWTIFSHLQENKYNCDDEDQEVDSSSSWINLPHSICFYLKILTVVLGYIFIVKGLASRL
jgi:hypothetical protein